MKIKSKLFGIVLAGILCCGVQGTVVAVSLGDTISTVSSADIMAGSEQSNLIRVILPTEFVALMYTEEEGTSMHIESQDVLFINQNDFPINVKIKGLTYEVIQKQRGISVENEIMLQVKEYQKEDRYISYDADSFIAFDITLKAAKEETEEKELLARALEWNPIEKVESDDYAILRLEGEINDVNLSEEDVRLGIIYELRKEIDEESM